MKVNILASGSSGNCIALTIGKSTILIDAGVAKTKIEKALLDVGINPTQVQAIFVTHAHGDHVKGLPLANKYKIPVYASEGEWKDIKSVDEELKHIAEPIQIDETFGVQTFGVHHDSYDPLGYTIENIETGYKVSVCLDTGKVDQNMFSAMRDSDVYIIESNHDEKMIEASHYPNSVRIRVLSDIGHLSNDQVGKALAKLIQGKGEQIYLVHLSSNNNLPGLAELTVMKHLHQAGYKAVQHYKLEVV